jgi:hypothetical protein
LLMTVNAGMYCLVPVSSAVCFAVSVYGLPRTTSMNSSTDTWPVSLYFDASNRTAHIFADEHITIMYCSRQLRTTYDEVRRN